MKYLLPALLLIISMATFAQSKRDTLEIPKHIKVIVIDGEVFEVIRKVELKKPEPLPKGFGWGGGYITPAIVDTLNANSPFILPNRYYSPSILMRSHNMDEAPPFSESDSVRIYPRQFISPKQTP